MTLDEWRTQEGLQWTKVARLLSEQRRGPIFENRLNRLRRGSTPTSDELAALMSLTNNECDCYVDGR